jgi:hypothetical protein
MTILLVDKAWCEESLHFHKIKIQYQINSYMLDGNIQGVNILNKQQNASSCKTEK